MIKIKHAVTLFASLLTSAAVMATTAKSINLDVEVTVPPTRLTSDIVYSQTHNNMGRPIQLSMDVIRPYGPDPLPAVVFVTGGGFMDAPKTKFIGQRVDMARAGYVVASINYRVVPMVTFPGNLEDVKTAIRYLRANASKYGIDPTRIAVMGESAGGYLAAMTAATNGVKEFDEGEYLDQSSEVQAAVDFYGPSDLTKIGADFSDEIVEAHKSPAIPEAMLVNGIPWQGGGSILSDLEKAEKANPLTYISSKTPPFLIMYGDADEVVSPSQSMLLHKALLDKGIESTAYAVKGGDHAGVLWYQPKIMDIVIKFLDEKLK